MNKLFYDKLRQLTLMVSFIRLEAVFSNRINFMNENIVENNETNEKAKKLNKIAKFLVYNHGIINLATEHAERLVKKYGSIKKVPRKEFKKLIKECKFNVDLTRVVFKEYLKYQKKVLNGKEKERRRKIEKYKNIATEGDLIEELF